MKKDEIWASAFITIFFSFLFYESLQLHAIRRFGEVGSGFWPIIVLSTAIILSLILLLTNLKKYFKEKKDISLPIASPDTTGKKKFIFSAICLLGYILIMPQIGFILSTFLFVIAFIFALEERRKLVLALSPFLVTALAIIIFAKFLGMPLPRGVSFFATFSRLIY